MTQVNRPDVSEVSICNQALGWLGSNQIMSLDDQSATANLCRNNYEHCRDAVLEARAWTFTIAREVSETADRDAWDQLYSHGMPYDWMRVLRVYRDVNGANRAAWSLDANWRLESGKILSQWPKLYLYGQKRVYDTGHWTPMFVQAVAARLAADLAMAITENRQLQIDMWQLYERKLSEAAANDGQQGSNDVITQTQLTDVRSSGGYGLGWHR